MTDPIEKAADAIVELINSQMRSPTKVEIMDVLRLHHPHRPDGYQLTQEALDKALNPVYYVNGSNIYSVGGSGVYAATSASDVTSWGATLDNTSFWADFSPPFDCSSVGGAHALGAARYNVLKDEYETVCSACGYTAVLQK